ncbi:hypothetical protein [Tepidibacillus marianensis]
MTMDIKLMEQRMNEVANFSKKHLINFGAKVYKVINNLLLI